MRARSVILLAIAGAALAACKAAPPRPEGGAITPVPDASTDPNTFELPAQTLAIQHDRADLEVEALWIAFHCLSKRGPPGGVALKECGELSVDGAPSELPITFPAAGRDRIAAKRVTFRFSKQDG